MNLLEWYPAVALAAILGGAWGWVSLQTRRHRKAVMEVAARLEGRYERGGVHSAGRLFVKCEGRDVVFTFDLAHSSRSSSTSVLTTLAKPVAKEIRLRGSEAVARAPRLAPYDRWIGPVRLRVSSNLVSMEIFGIVRRADALVDLASIVAALAAELERT